MFLDAIDEVMEKYVKFRVKKDYDTLLNKEFFQVQMIKKIQGIFFENMELYNFPFDVQVYRFIIFIYFVFFLMLYFQTN